MKIHIRWGLTEENKIGRRRCPHCEKTLKGSLSNLRAHMRLHIGVKPIIEATAFDMMGHPNAEKCCQCKICDATFDRIVKLRAHIRSHGTTDASLQTRINANQNLNDLYEITNSGGWELTLSDSETDADDSGGEEIDGRMEPMTSNVATSYRMHTCGSCDRSFDRRYRLIVHMNFEHAKTKSIDFERFRCISCDQLYPNEEILAKHLRDQCNNTQKKFFCTECGARFEWSNSLKLHTQKVHQIKKIQCDTCGKQFRRIQDFTRHQKAHVDNKKKDSKKQKSTANDAFIYPREFTSKICRRVGDSKGRKGGYIKLVTCDICHREFSRKDNLK